MSYKINKWIKQEFRRMKQEKKRCAKQYPDWRDDEYNMLQHKFIWGLPNDPKDVPSFSTINKATLAYNRDTEMYELYVGCDYLDMNDPQSQEALISYLREVKNAMADYVYAQDADGKLVFPRLSLDDMGDPFSGKTVLEVYAKLTFLLWGFKEYYN